MKSKIVKRVKIAKESLKFTLPRNKGGRPPTRHGMYDPARMLGRVSEEQWDKIKAGAEVYREATGGSFTEWAVGVLLREAKRLTDARKMLTSGEVSVD